MSIEFSDLLQIIGILCSLITSIIAIVISIATLKQSSKMIEDSTRPYLILYGDSVHIDSSDYYLILKNTGQSNALIESFCYDFDLQKCVYRAGISEPFKNIEGTTLVPGQSCRAVIDFSQAIQHTNSINFYIKYSSGSKHYEDDICVNLVGNTGNFVIHHTTAGKELAYISDVLQDMNIRNL